MRFRGQEKCYRHCNCIDSWSLLSFLLIRAINWTVQFSTHEFLSMMVILYFTSHSSLFVISRRWKDDNERLSAMTRNTVISWIPPPAGFEPPWFETGSANHSATRRFSFLAERYDVPLTLMRRCLNVVYPLDSVKISRINMVLEGDQYNTRVLKGDDYSIDNRFSFKSFIFL